MVDFLVEHKRLTKIGVDQRNAKLFIHNILEKRCSYFLTLQEIYQNIRIN